MWVISWRGFPLHAVQWCGSNCGSASGRLTEPSPAVGTSQCRDHLSLPYLLSSRNSLLLLSPACFTISRGSLYCYLSSSLLLLLGVPSVCHCSPPSGWLKQQKLTFSSPGGWKSRSRYHQAWFLVRPLLACRWPPLTVSSRGLLSVCWCPWT